MKSKFNYLLVITFFLLFFLSNKLSFAHCDSMEGPVVKASKTALETGNINYVLIWIREVDEQEIKDLFNRVLEVRKLNDTAKELADNYFFETVVRVHRMGEGVAYTGLKPADYKPEEGIETADAAIEKNSVDEILAHLDESEYLKVKALFGEVTSKKNFNINDVNAGRDYVASYVHFIHYVEELFY
jgi:hypothetical protein